MTPCPTPSHGHSAEVSPLVVQSETVAAVILFSCFKKTMASVTSQAPGTKKEIHRTETPAPLLAASLTRAMELLLEGVCRASEKAKFTTA